MELQLSPSQIDLVLNALSADAMSKYAKGNPLATKVIAVKDVILQQLSYEMN